MQDTEDTHKTAKLVRKLNIANTFRKIIKEVAKAEKPEGESNIPLSRAEMKVVFEKEFEGKLDFTPYENGNGQYQSHLSNAILYAFRTALKEGRRSLIGINSTRRLINETFDGKIKGPFIVGTMVEDNSVQFGYRPRKHDSVPGAMKEAHNLHKRFGKNFAVFGLMGEVKGPELKVEESRQKENGKVKTPTINSQKVMLSLSKYLMDNLGKLEDNTPTGIAFNVDEGGVWQVLGKGLQVLGSGRHDQCIHFINDWLRVKGFGLIPPPEVVAQQEQGEEHATS